jgi:N,N'-diacetyllegionaminate synthase
MSSWGEIDKVTSFLQAKSTEIALFQCTSQYPSGLETIGLNIITEMKEKYSCATGLSDHSGSIFPSLLALGRKVDIIEVHATFHRKMFGPDVPVSLTFDELKQIREARDAFSVMDNNPVNKDEIASQLDNMRELFTRSLALKKSQLAGTVLTAEMLTTKKPGTGIASKDLDQCIGKTLRHDTSENRLLNWDDLS